MTFDAQRFDSSTPNPVVVDIQKRKILMEPTPVYTNKFYTAFQKDGMVRIVFADEEVDANGNVINEIVRNSIIMTLSAFILLSNTFGKSADQIMKQQEIRGIKQTDQSGENGEKMS